MAAVSLHPLASRGGEQSATVVSLQVNSACEASTSTSWLADNAAAASRYPGADADEMRRGSAEMPSSPTTRGGSPTDSRFDAGDEPEWGLRHRDLSSFPSLDGIFDGAEAPCTSSASAPPIRAMSASQLAALHEQYVHADVPHHVVFPFLHGVDGDNTAQNMFFGAPLDGQPTPNYRGLTLVRADMPTRDQAVAMQRRRASSSASGLGMSAARRSRAGSLATTTSSSGHSLASGESHSGNSSDGDSPSPPGAAHRSPFKHSASSHSVSSSLASSELSSAHSLWNNSETSSAATSVSGGGMAWEGKGSAYPSTSGTSSCASAHEPQPRHSILNSSILPAELIEPPRSAKLSDGRIVTAPSTFVQPRQAAGVSLRNFRIQSVRYATISDIVLYCPAGLHEGVLALARCFREAQAAMYEERCSRGLGSLRYNVFVVTDPFVAFERSHEHLVAIDSAGTPRNRVDFIEREREEMQRLTAASEIDENVWMGCTADVPMPAAADVDMDPSAAPLDAQSRSAQSNPHAFSICVEAHENGDTPELSRLTYASHWLDSIEATALFELNSKEALRQLEEDEPIVDASGAIGEADLRGFLSLGPNGWSPSSPGRARKNSRRGQTPRSDADAAQPAAAQRTSVVPKPENIIHLECAASSSGFNAMGQEQAIESIVQLCQWIKKQAQPGQMASPVPSAAAAANASSLLAGAFRSSGHGPRSQSHGATPLLGSAPAQASHSPRRVLLHCGDGYTETSILALAYLMYSRDLSLPDAYLDLQLRCKRSFFVYARDMAFLKRVEARMVRERRALRLLQEQREEREAAIAAAAAATADAAAPRSALSKPSFSWGVGGASDEAGKRIGGLASRRSTSSRRGSSSSADVSGHALTEPSVWARGLAAASVLVGAAQGHQGGRKSSSMATDARTRTPTPRGARSPVMSPTKLTAAPASGDRRWFSDARFEGSFPSRILPFLYLGNLNHALNPAMLHALGITHVVSVGETALTPPASEFTMATDGDASPAALPAPPSLHNSLWHEERAGRISVLDLKNVSDDGIDPLRSTMREAVEYIEAARRSGGSVLVHCRVGVSRSSTIVLAYVMGHLDLNLVEAYLLVRSRRLNILIQPHLLFFWELRGWETYLAAQKAKRTHGGRRSENEEMADGTGASLLDSFSRLTPSDDAAMEVSTMSRIADRVSRPALPWRRATSAGDEAARGRSRSLGRRGLGHSGMLEAEAEEQHADLDMDLGLGAGSLHRAEPLAAELVAALPFGSGSPSSLSAASMRLTWGFLCREITALNERYFI